MSARIVTAYIYPPIPERCFDWQATREGEYDGAPDAGWPPNCIGFGPTEQAAIDDLIGQEEP